jgi:OFA family oxalate/formate antiporter-like MFS transporter
MTGVPAVQRYLVLAAALLIQVCLGGVYAWSVFVPWLMADHGLTTTQTQAVFGTTIAVFTVVMVYSGRIVERRGPRVLTAIAGVLFAGGYAVASLSGASFPGLIVGIGILAGAGIGAGYVCPLTVSMKWFPDHKGLITGITVAGFASGAVVLSVGAQRLWTAGLSAPQILLAVGLVYGAIIVLSGLMLAVPPTQADQGTRIKVWPVVRQPLFWSLVIGMFSGTFAGLLIIGNLKPLALSEGISAPAATAAISAFAFGNAAGRIVWGWLYDRVGQPVIPASLLVLGATVAALTLARNDAAFILCAAAVGFGFGACFVVYAAHVAARWGAAAVGAVYPLVFLAYGLSGIMGPLTGGWLFDTTSSYVPAITVAAVLTTVSAGVLALRQRRAIADRA